MRCGISTESTCSDLCLMPWTLVLDIKFSGILYGPFFFAIRLVDHVVDVHRPCKEIGSTVQILIDGQGLQMLRISVCTSQARYDVLQRLEKHLVVELVTGGWFVGGVEGDEMNAMP